MSRLDLSGTFKRTVRSVSLFGFGRSAAALVPHLLDAGYSVTVRDDREDIQKFLPSTVRCFSGRFAQDSVNEDIMIIAPSVRRDRFYRGGVSPHTLLTSDTEIFFKAFSGKAFCISGSSGKSTTATMLHEILSSSGDSHLIGNIGVPMTDALLRESIGRAVCEISSFNLQYDEIKPYRATVTNIKRNHLNWHHSFEEYIEAKTRLLSSALCFSVNFDDDITRKFASFAGCYACYSLNFDYKYLHSKHKHKIILTRTPHGIMRNDKLIIPNSLISEYREYDIYNLLSALSVADGEYDMGALGNVIAAHRTLSHRCEEFRSSNGIRFIDSSIDTSPDRTLATLSSLSGNLFLLLGGRTKGESYSSLKKAVREKCKNVFAFGEARERIVSELGNIGVPVSTHETMREAVLSAIAALDFGDTLLLSPASTSFDEFSSFEERGDRFKKIINDALGHENTGVNNEKDI